MGYYIQDVMSGVVDIFNKQISDKNDIQEELKEIKQRLDKMDYDINPLSGLTYLSTYSQNIGEITEQTPSSFTLEL